MRERRVAVDTVICRFELVGDEGVIAPVVVHLRRADKQIPEIMA